MPLEYWEDNLELIAQFGEKGLNISSTNVYLAFLKLFYENVLHKSLVRKEKSCVTHFANIAPVMQKLLDALKKEIRTNLEFASPKSEMNYLLNVSLKFTLTNKAFNEYLEIYKGFWSHFPAKETSIKYSC